MTEDEKAVDRSDAPASDSTVAVSCKANSMMVIAIVILSIIAITAMGAYGQLRKIRGDIAKIAVMMEAQADGNASPK